MSVDKSLEVFILPFLGQAAPFNAVNQSLAIIGAENSTVHAIAVPAYACPDDPLSGIARDRAQGQLAAYARRIPPTWFSQATRDRSARLR